MGSLTLSLEQTAEVVTDLARGKSPAQVAARRHLAVLVVEQMAALYGPGRVELTRNMKVLNKRLRDQPAVEDLDVDVPISVPEPDGSVPVVEAWIHDDHAAGHYPESCEACAHEPVPEPVAAGHEETVELPGPVNVQAFVCEECGWELWMSSLAPRRDVDALVAAHVKGHPIEDGPILAGRAVEQQLVIAASVPGHNHTDEARREATCPACRADQETPLIVEGEVVVAPPLNGHAPERVGDRLAATPLISPTPPLVGEADPAAATVEVVEPAAGVEEPPAAPAPALPEPGGWLVAGPRTVERLLDEAEKSGHAPLMDAAVAVRSLVQDLADRVDRWADTAEQRRVILAELDVLGRRQDELVEKLARLDRGAVWGPDVVVASVDSDWRDACDTTADATPPAAVVAVAGSRLAALPYYRMSREARSRCKAWAIEYGLPHAEKGQQPKATVAAYLSAHPEDDPR